MTDKEKLDAIRAEIHRLVDVRGYDREMANDLFTFMDSLPNEPVSEDLNEAAIAYNKKVNFVCAGKIPNEHFIAGANWQKQQDKQPVNDDLEEAAKNHAAERYRTTRDRELAEKCKWSFKAGAQWKEKKGKRPISDNLEEEIDYLSKRYPEVSFAKLTRIAVHVAKWQMQQIFKVKEDAKLWTRDYEDDFEDEFSKILAERKEMLPKSEERFSDLDLYRVALHFNGWKEHQMMKDAIKTTIKAGIDSIGILVKGLDSNKYSFGDKVKLIIIKQEEE